MFSRSQPAVAFPLFLAFGPYSNEALWPGLVANFSASPFAFLVALPRDRRRRAADERRERDQRAVEVILPQLLEGSWIASAEA